MTSAEELWQPRLTPDGSEILYVSTPQSSDPETFSSIFAIPIAGGTPRLVLKDISHLERAVCALAIDDLLVQRRKGKYLENVPVRCERVGKVQIPRKSIPHAIGACPPMVRNERHRMLITTAERFNSDPHLTGKTRDLVVKGWNELKNVDWSADGKSLLVSWDNHERDSALLKVTLDGKASVLLRSRNDLWAIPSPDGRLLAIAEDSRHQECVADREFQMIP